jgi:peptidyl-dipeptidase Dcp
MLAQDAFAWFESHGGLTRANGQRFRDLVLSRGNTEDYGEMYRSFTGHDPDIRPYLEYYGLPTTGTGPTTVTPEASPAPAQVPAPAAAPAPQKGERGR